MFILLLWINGILSQKPYNLFGMKKNVKITPYNIPANHLVALSINKFFQSIVMQMGRSFYDEILIEISEDLFNSLKYIYSQIRNNLFDEITITIIARGGKKN